MSDLKSNYYSKNPIEQMKAWTESILVNEEIYGDIISPKCAYYEIHGINYTEYNCGYPTIIDCDDCKYGGGTKDPTSEENTEEIK
jgi:hypothetical protein